MIAAALRAVTILPMAAAVALILVLLTDAVVLLWHEDLLIASVALTGMWAIAVAAVLLRFLIPRLCAAARHTPSTTPDDHEFAKIDILDHRVVQLLGALGLPVVAATIGHVAAGWPWGATLAYTLVAWLGVPGALALTVFGRGVVLARLHHAEQGQRRWTVDGGSDTLRIRNELRLQGHGWDQVVGDLVGLAWVIVVRVREEGETLRLGSEVVEVPAPPARSGPGPKVRFWAVPRTREILDGLADRYDLGRGQTLEWCVAVAGPVYQALAGGREVTLGRGVNRVPLSLTPTASVLEATQGHLR